MLFVIWIPLVTQFLVPVALLVWVATGRPASRVELMLRILSAAAYLLAIAMAGLWLVLPWYTPVLYFGLLLPAAAWSLQRSRTLPLWPVPRRGVARLVLTGILLSACTAMVVHVLMAWRSPASVLELAFPLRNGTYMIVNGGGSSAINAHLKTLSADRFRQWRGQSYGVDITKLDRFGLRADGILPRDLRSYAIFGTPVHAPCAGTVVAAVDGIEEMVPPHMDRDHLAGNHVIMQCGSAWILLGHLQRGSVRVRPGAHLSSGQPLGRVGNTGNTNEPHLHIHAQRVGTPEAPLAGEPLFIRFGKRYPARNQRIKAPLGSGTGA